MYHFQFSFTCNTRVYVTPSYRIEITCDFVDRDSRDKAICFYSTTIYTFVPIYIYSVLYFLEMQKLQKS